MMVFLRSIERIEPIGPPLLWLVQGLGARSLRSRAHPGRCQRGGRFFVGAKYEPNAVTEDRSCCQNEVTENIALQALTGCGLTPFAGSLRHTPGVIALVALARERGLDAVYVPAIDARE